MTGFASTSGAEESFLACSTCPPMVVIPAGSSVMGDDSSNFANEKPARPVVISRAFALGRTEVTFDQWQACVGDGGCKGGQDDHGWGRGQRPAINMTWDEARAFARWVARKAGLSCRLPTEAEWEYAARAGTTSGFWWGDKAGGSNANCRDCVAGDPHPYGTKPVGSYKPNPWGLFDMSGNVWEWTADCWSPTHAAPPPNEENCPEKVVKGGSWYYFSAMSRASARAKNDARAHSYNIGVRVLCELP
ncbi:formylglycine-generating enzyme family protein [Paramagnetospirillum marisnigri]|nr:SUMF1/EgtB/PvdO family nonheme iron enzyme [Paramagnetospirillum marisnigri]